MRLQRYVVRGFVAIAAAILALPLTSSSALAQDVPLANLLPELILREIVLQSPAAGLSHQAHFSPLEANEPNNPAVGIVQGFNSQLATQFATFPLGSSAGSLTYVFDESLGTLRRGSSSFGPLFAERALTIGRRKFSAGFNYQRTSYDTFEGQKLENGSIKFYLRHEDCCGLAGQPAAPFFSLLLQPSGDRFSPPFEGDLIEAALSLEATTHTTAAFATYGVTDHWDVGVAIPFVMVDIDASVEARVIRLVTAQAPNVHTFEAGNPDATRSITRTGHARGLGDIVLRSKYHFLRMAGGGLAAAADLRLPTGDETELLGTGGFQAKVLIVGSTEQGRFGEHVNIGYTAADGTVGSTFGELYARQVPDEINYSAGVEFVATPRLTLTGDFVGRTLRNAGRLDLMQKTFEYVEPASIVPLSPTLTLAEAQAAAVIGRFQALEFEPRAANLTLMLGTAGVKFNPLGNWLLSGSVLFPLTDAGLRSRLTIAVGMEYAF
jgi:hypothetical protein